MDLILLRAVEGRKGFNGRIREGQKKVSSHTENILYKGAEK